MKKIVMLACVSIALVFSSQAGAQTQELCAKDYMENKVYILHNSVIMLAMGAMKSLLDPFEKENPPEKSNNGPYCLLEAFTINTKNIRLYYHRAREESDIHYVATVEEGKSISHFFVHNLDELAETMEAPKKFPVKTRYALVYRKGNDAEAISGFYGEPSARVIKYMISLYLEGKPILFESSAVMTIEGDKE